jgi:RNA polymerase sigma factor (sigma-70 family)
MSDNEKLDVAPLVRAARRGDATAWRELVVQISPMLRRAAGGFRLRSEDIDDVVQITWLQILKKLDTLRDPEALVGWLLVTVRRESLRTLQGGLREVPMHDVDGVTAVDPIRVEEIVFERERETVVRSAVDRLPARQRVLLLQMLSAPAARYGEIAKDLEMSVGSIGPTRQRALDRLRTDEGILALVA